MQLDSLLNEDGDLFARLARCDAARKVWHIGTKAARALLDDNEILHMRPHFFRPACFRMLFNVPGGTSTLGLPATVTVPALEVWWYWR